MKRISKTKKILITILSSILLFAISCSSNENPSGGGGGGLDIPKASGNPVTMNNIVLSGYLKCTLPPNGWSSKAEAEAFINDSSMTTNVDGEKGFVLIISNNTAYGLYAASSSGNGSQLLCPDSSNPNVVEASGEFKEEGSSISDYIKITFDDFTNITKAEVMYLLKMSADGMNMECKNEGTLTNNTELKKYYFGS